MPSEHLYWWLLVMACLGWYATVTVYVAIRGAIDIRQMLTHLARIQGAVDTLDDADDDPAANI